MSWMAWTLPSALFFIGIAVSLIVMTVLELRMPTTLRRGFLPMATTRGDRFFISLLSAAFIHLAWLGGFGNDGADSIWVASVVSFLLACVLLRWG